MGRSFLRIRNATLKFVGSSTTVREDGSILLSFLELGKHTFPPEIHGQEQDQALPSALPSLRRKWGGILRPLTCNQD